MKPQANQQHREASSAALARLPRPLRGIVPPLVTPLAGRDQLDVAGLERLLERVLAGGASGLFLLGTTGEAAALSPKLRRELVERAVPQVDRRAAVLVGVTSTSLVETLASAEHAASAGADAIVVMSPYYLPLEQAELLKLVDTIHDESPLPVYLYNMPRLAGSWLSLELVREAMQMPNVVGLKDSSGDMTYFAAAAGMLPQRPDWTLLMGPEELMVEAVALGGHGCVGGGANVHPALLVELYAAATAGDHSRIAALQQKLALLGTIYAHGEYGAAVIRGLKCALALLGVCNEQMAPPFLPCDHQQRAKIAACLEELGLASSPSS
jgi:4-hydroxy-tetrahydrodipicolinate synthase